MLKTTQLSCRNQNVDKVQLWPWPLDPKKIEYLPLTILHLCMKYESCTLKTTQVIVSELVLTDRRKNLIISRAELSFLNIATKVKAIG